MTLSVFSRAVRVASLARAVTVSVASLARAVRLSVVSPTLVLTSSSVALVFSVAVAAISRVRAVATPAALRASATGSMSTSSDRPLSGDRLSLMRKMATANSATMRTISRVNRKPAMAVTGAMIQFSGSRCTASMVVLRNSSPK